MSVCMSSMLLWAFKFVPPVSKQMPLPTKLTAGAAAPRGRYDQKSDARIAQGIAARHREERAASQALELSLAVEFEVQFQTLRKLLQQPAIAGGVQCVGRQSGQPASKIVAGCGCQGQIHLVQLSTPREVNTVERSS